MIWESVQKKLLDVSFLSKTDFSPFANLAASKAPISSSRDNESFFKGATLDFEAARLVMILLLILNLTYSSSKKKRNTPIYFSTNYRTEMKLVPIIMDHCLLQFDALKFSLGVRLHKEGGVST